eukprot:Tamp_27862.p2 GENE.Tamp_27862~~Tamp_27862.p2  ORF type:complete len:145 (+),score=16.52 Tamp_27862:318-752(+)
MGANLVQEGALPFVQKLSLRHDHARGADSDGHGAAAADSRACLPQRHVHYMYTPTHLECSLWSNETFVSATSLQRRSKLMQNAPRGPKTARREQRTSARQHAPVFLPRPVWHALGQCSMLCACRLAVRLQTCCAPADLRPAAAS